MKTFIAILLLSISAFAQRSDLAFGPGAPFHSGDVLHFDATRDADLTVDKVVTVTINDVSGHLLSQESSKVYRSGPRWRKLDVTLPNYAGTVTIIFDKYMTDLKIEAK